MSEENLSFRQESDKDFWTGQIKDQDNWELAPYKRWIAAREKDQDRILKDPVGELEDRFCILYVSDGGGNIPAVNEAIRSCTVPYMIISAGDIRFSPDAFFVFSKVVSRENKPDFIYCDEDRIDENGERSDPFFKPAWSPDTLMSFLYTGRMGVFRTELLKKVGGLRSEYGEAAFYDLVLRFTEKAGRICHISKILYHVAAGEDLKDRGSGDDREKRQDQIRVKKDALRRRGIPGTVTWNEEYSEADVVYSVQGDPLVSIIIPSRDHYDMLAECLESIRDLTRYSHYELIIVDNGSSPEQKSKIETLIAEHGARYIYHPMKFNFSVMCNLGAEHASGEYLLFLNDDISIVHEDWLERMLGQAQLPHAGAVGAKLLYPGSDLIQHAGILNLLIGPVHALMGRSDKEDWYYHRNKVTYDFSAVTGACLMVSGKKFREAGGMDERLSVGYNDVGLCFALMKLGYKNCVRNDVTLIHYESASRGLDELSEKKQLRLKLEKRLLYETYPWMKGKDLYYSRYLNRAGNDYSLDMLFSTKPCARLRGPLYPSKQQVPYAIDTVEKIADVYTITGWIAVGQEDEYIVERKLALEDESGRGLVFPLNRLRIDDEKLKQIRNEDGELFTPYVWFRITVRMEDLSNDGKYQIVLIVKNPEGENIVVKTGSYLQRCIEDI